jgi:O-antigen biosynthesis protein
VPQLSWSIDEPSSDAPRGRGALSGWVFALDGSELTGIRARVGEHLLAGTFGIARPEVRQARSYLNVPLECGFEVQIADVGGEVDVELEVQVKAEGWLHLCDVPLAFAHLTLEAHIDSVRPLGDDSAEVMVEGWAAHPGRPHRKLFLFDGVTRFQCETSLPRPDLRLLPWTRGHVFTAGYRVVVPALALGPATRFIAEYADGGTGVAVPSSLPRLERAAAAAVVDTDRTDADLLQRLQSIVSALPPLDGPPAFSLLTPTYRTKLTWLVQLAASLSMQTYRDWEWCLADDGSRDELLEKALNVLRSAGRRVRVVQRRTNGGISAATNTALEMAQGRYACCVDHDDLLAPAALERCAEVLERTGADAVYTDSDKVDLLGLRFEPFHKPAWSPEYFRGVMYVGHLLCFRTALAREIGGFDSAFDTIQDYEFFLRYSERASSIEHVPEILYHWRAVPGSIASSLSAKGSVRLAQERAVQEQLDRIGLPARATAAYNHFVVAAPLPREQHPKISIVIPTRDADEVLKRCLSSLFSRTTYSNFEVVVVDNETSEPAALRTMKSFPVKRVLYNGRFNFSRENNAALPYCEGEYLVLLNNDVEIVTAEWLEGLLYYAEQSDVGAVGPLLLYPNETVQHAGVVLGPRGTADHKLRGASSRTPGYAGTLAVAHEVSAVTGACLMTSRERYERAGGLLEYYWTVYQDVDLCLGYRQRGLRNVVVPSVVLLHHESYTRKSYYDHVDRALLLDRFGGAIAAGDPYYNRNFNQERSDYTV